VEIKNFRKNEKLSALKCAFTIYIPEWGHQEIDCVYFEKDNSAYWINFAAKEYTNKEGKRKSFNQTRWPQYVTDKLKESIRVLILPLLNAAGTEPQVEEPIGELPF